MCSRCRPWPPGRFRLPQRCSMMRLLRSEKPGLCRVPGGPAVPGPAPPAASFPRPAPVTGAGTARAGAPAPPRAPGARRIPGHVTARAGYRRPPPAAPRPAPPRPGTGRDGTVTGPAPPPGRYQAISGTAGTTRPATPAPAAPQPHRNVTSPLPWAPQCDIAVPQARGRAHHGHHPSRTSGAHSTRATMRHRRGCRPERWGGRDSRDRRAGRGAGEWAEAQGKRRQPGAVLRWGVPVRPHTGWMVLGRDRVRGRSPAAIFPLNQDRIRAIPNAYTEKHAPLRHRSPQPARRYPTGDPASGKRAGDPASGKRTARGRPPGRSSDSASEWIRSPCRRRHRRGRREPGSSPASPRSRPQW
jgi:hypothetical protein